MGERGTGRGGGHEQAKREYLDKESWRLFWCGHSLVGAS